MNIKTYIKKFIIPLFVYSLIPLFVYSQVFAQALTLPWDGGGKTITGFTGFSFGSIGDVITRAVPFAFAASGIGLLFMLIASGFSFLTSAGDSKKLEQGKQRLTYALVGFLIIFVSYWLVQIAGTIFGFTVIGTVFK